MTSSRWLLCLAVLLAAACSRSDKHDRDSSCQGGKCDSDDDEEGTIPLLKRFLPNGLARLYQKVPCPSQLGACELYAARDDLPRFLRVERDTERAIPGDDVLIHAVVPSSGALSVAPLPRAIAAGGPPTYAVRFGSESGRVQIRTLPGSGDVLASWLPDPRFGRDDAPTIQFTTVEPATVAPPQATITELPVANQPDVAHEDSHGNIWFSAWNHEIYKITPATNEIHAMTNGEAGTADGLFVDSHDRVWFGAYNEGWMGELTPTVKHHDMPYASSHPAIPCEAPDGKIWITDHQSNKLTEYDPTTGSWLRSIEMPVPQAWVVQCQADSAAPVLWLTLSFAKAIGRLDLTSGAIESLSVPCQPAFLDLAPDGGIWASCWDNGYVLNIDYAHAKGTVYKMVDSAQAGGIQVGDDGTVYFTQNVSGRIGILRPSTNQASALQLPSQPQFKDGLLLDHSGTLWAPSPSGQLMGKIVF